MHSQSAQSCLNLTKDFQGLAQPLTNYLGIEDFGFKRVYKNGSNFFLATHLPYLSDYFNNSKYTVEIPTQATDKTSLYCPWKQLAQNDKNFSKALNYYHDRFNRGNGFFVVKDFEKYTDLYMLVTTACNEKADFKFLTEIEPIEKFIEHLQFEGAKIIHSAEQALIPPTPKPFHLLNNQTHNEKLQQFYNTIGAGRARIICKDQSNILLTQRESQCLRYIAQGSPVKQVAQALNITPSTVELHLNRIKHKTGYHYNSDLATCYWQHNSVANTGF